ncbi:MAG TPA: HU family DNA-binding protein, partial [Longimicrobiaceae bacterium]|nr:HU family DNA-binding protein [Longimicrobiaceae bacterium]
ARTGRNPRTGKEIKIGPSTSASFRAGKGLKDSLSR